MPSQAQLIRQSWGTVEPVLDRIAQYFYAALFQRNPALRELFPPAMTVQRVRLVRALGRFVQLVDQPAELSFHLGELGRDHRKFEIEPSHYDDVRHALLYALRLHLREQWTPELEHAWLDGYAAMAREMMRAADEAAIHGPPNYRGTVVDVDHRGAGVTIVTVKPDPPMTFLPGQYVSVETPRRPRMWRALSMANSPAEGAELEFHIKSVPGGWVSGSLVNETQPGDVWRLGPPVGGLGLIAHGTRDLLLIGGGTGIAPLLSILPELRRRPDRPHTSLFHGVRYSRELYLNGVLDELAARDPLLDVTRVVSRDPSFLGARGSLPDVVAQRGDWSGHDVVVSGSPGLIQATLRTLGERGVPLSRIYYDAFNLD